jgi:hypothetical protein
VGAASAAAALGSNCRLQLTVDTYIQSATSNYTYFLYYPLANYGLTYETPDNATLSLSNCCPTGTSAALTVYRQ